MFFRNILNFLKSLVLPVKMVKYRYMSVLLGIILFILSAILLTIPVGTYYKENSYKLIEERNIIGLRDLLQAPSNEESLVFQKLSEIKDAGFKVEYNETDKNYQLTYRVDDIIQEEHRSLYEFSYLNEEEQNVNVHIIVDIFNLERDENLEGNEKEKVLPPTKITSEEDIKDNYQFINYDSLSEAEQQELIGSYYVRINKLDNSENIHFKPSIDNNHIVVILGTDSLFYSYHNVIKENEEYIDNPNISTAKIFWSIDYSFNANEMINYNAKTSLDNFARLISRGFAAQLSLVTQFSIFLYVFLFPMIIVLMVFILFRKSGRLQTLKEYFNIAAISTIVPVLITFIVSWFYFEAYSFYVFVFATYYLLMILKINTVKEILD